MQCNKPKTPFYVRCAVDANDVVRYIARIIITCDNSAVLRLKCSIDCISGSVKKM